MKSLGKRLAAAFVAFALVLGCISGTSVSVQAVEYENTYVNTGDQRADILGVALTQLGYTEGYNNDTKYGTWYGLPRQPWCAAFVSWCAEVADIPDTIIDRTGRAHPSWFGLKWKSGTSYTPKPGDLFFTPEFTHVGLVYKVEGSYFYSIEGNSNTDGSEDGTCVVSNKHAISAFRFSSPSYKGSDKDHSYTLCSESAHPHKTYYQCSTCGEKHYTGKTAFCGTCATCTACGCSSSFAGSYISIASTTLRIRSSHSDTSSTVGYLPSGGTVQVLAAKAGAWAHIRYEAYEGYVPLKYLCKPPLAPTLTVPSAQLYAGDTMRLSWSKVSNATSYQLTVSVGGATVIDRNVGNVQSYSVPELCAGSYTLSVRALNQAGSSEKASASVTVLPTYTVCYDAGAGTGSPEAAVKKHGVDLTLSDTVPVCEGCSFLGWATEGTMVTHFPGQLFTSDSDTTLHAVWKQDDATAQSLSILTMPLRTLFLPEDALDTAGLTLALTYSDGSGLPITDGYTATELQPELGVQTVTVSYENLTVCYDVRVVHYIPGDFNGNHFVNRDDVMYLLWHLSFPEQFPITIPADYTLDGYINRDDVMHLLWYLSFPDQFPLEEVQ